MKKDIRAEILHTAKLLFGETGYNNVSMRNIADKVGISVGNLTYHFKKKEDLIETVVMDQHQHYVTPAAPETLTELHDMFWKSIRHQEENAYYFRHYAQLAQCCPKVYEIQKKVKKERRGVLCEAFQNMQERGYIEPEAIEGQFIGTAQVLTMISAYGIPDYKDTVSPVQCMWSIVYPMLTESGKEIFHREIERQIR